MNQGITVVRLRGTKVDDGYGGERIDFAEPDRLPIEGCGIAPLVEDELTVRGRAGVVVGWTLYAPYGADITYQDRVELPGIGDCQVDGEPGDWRSHLTGREHGTTVRLKRVEG